MAGKPGRGGRKGRSGRKPSPSTQGRTALQYIEDNIMEITHIAVRAALNGDVTVALQLQNRLWGLPKIKSETETTFKLSADQLAPLLISLEELKQEQQGFITHHRQPFALIPPAAQVVDSTASVLPSDIQHPTSYVQHPTSDVLRPTLDEKPVQEQGKIPQSPIEPSEAELT